jgi:hypothetical protein
MRESWLGIPELGRLWCRNHPSQEEWHKEYEHDKHQQVEAVAEAFARKAIELTPAP